MLGLLLSAFLGCSDYAMIGVEKREAEILVHPMHLDFGHLQSGFESFLLAVILCRKEGSVRAPPVKTTLGAILASTAFTVF